MLPPPWLDATPFLSCVGCGMRCLGLQVAVDIVHHKTMNELHQKVAPSQVIVGW